MTAVEKGGSYVRYILNPFPMLLNALLCRKQIVSRRRGSIG